MSSAQTTDMSSASISRCYKSRLQTTLSFLGTILVFALLWSAPRFCLFQDQAMMHDDYFMAATDNVYNVFFIQEYRILGGVFPMLCKWSFSNFYGTNTPIFLNALLIGAISTCLFRLLLKIQCGSWLAAAVTLVFCWHPVINDMSAWNTPGFGLVSALLIVAGFLFGWTGTMQGLFLATCCIWSSLATYQLMIPLPMVLTIMAFVHKGAVDGRWEWRRAFNVAAAMVLALVFYLAYVLIISPMIFGPFGNGSGIKSLGQVLADSNGLKMQTINLYLNLYYSMFSYYAGIKPGLSLWYYAPLAIVSLGLIVLTWGVYQKRIKILSATLLITCWLGLPFLAIAPLWFIPLYTEWRISFIVLIPEVMVIGSIAATLRHFATEGVSSVADDSPPRVRYCFQFLLPCAVLSIAGLMVPVTIADCQMRLDDYRHDRKIVESIRAFRNSLGASADDHRVVYRLDERPILSLTGNERPLMKANYLINTYSTFSYGKIWAYAMFRWYDLPSITEGDLDITSLANEPHSVDQKITRYAELPYVIHYPKQKLSVVVGCPQWLTWTVAQ